MMQKIIKYIFKAIVVGIVVSCAVAGILMTIEVVLGRQISFDQNLIRELGYYMIYGVVLTTINSWFFDYLNTEVIWGKYKKNRIIIGVVGSIILTLVGIFFIRMFISLVFEKETMTGFLQQQTVSNYLVPLLITLVISLFFHAVYFYKKSQEKKVIEQQIIAGTASAKFETLKNQIDPHFLFNSLNVLSSLIEENPDNAQKFTTSLSKIYRYVLEQKDKELVNIEEELSFAKTYMNLLRMRFENSLSYELPEVIPNTEARVVPLSLQLLLENTVKHNIVSEQKPLHIKIYIENDYLVIQNNFQKKEVLQDRKGVGIQNIVNRYGIITNRKVLIEQNEKHFSVSIPILTKQISVMETTYNNDEQNSYYKAQKRVEDIKGFYGNLGSYVIVNIGLAILNLVTAPQYLWFIFPAIGWGIGVVIHGLSVFNYIPFLGSDWEERKIQQLMDREKSNKWQ